MWHASVALQGPSRTVLLKLWGAPEHAEARRLLRQLLGGVGVGPTNIGVQAPVLGPSFALHAKRVLSGAEKAQLTPEWCALPAIDQEGGLTLESADW